MDVRVQEADFDVGQELASLRAGRRDIGALAAFVGLVRDLGENGEVAAMELEHYPAMTRKALEGICREAQARWDILDVRVIHRVGRLLPADQIVFVAVASRHRRDAFAACEFIMDFLKTRAPFWKKEHTPGGSRWVEARESDEAAARRWQYS